MAFAVVVAFGYGKDAVVPLPPDEAAADLRRLVDQACASTFAAFPTDVQVSIAPGGVMLAFPDAEPTRALQLCEAVAVQLAHRRQTQPTLTPLCAALTSGELRAVDVLGYHTNFEGHPAIAAARILHIIPAGWVAVEQSLWEFPTVLRDLEEAQTIPGKHDGERFAIRVHRRIRLPTGRATPTPVTAVPVPSAPNPFTWRGGIRRTEDFYNRERELSTLRAYLHNRGHCQIVGERRIGKTSLLLHVERLAVEWKPGTTVAYMDLQDARCHAFSSWLALAGQRLGFTRLPTDMISFAEQVDAALGVGQHLVLCLDEFEELMRRRTAFPSNFFIALRACGQQGLSILTASQKRLSELTDRHDASSPFYNTFALLPLRPFRDAEAQRFVQLSRPGVVPFTAEEEHDILHFAHGHPLALQVACFHVLQAKAEGTSRLTALRRAYADMQGHLVTWMHQS